MATIGIQLDEYIGTADTLVIWLSQAGALLNAGGDTLAEVGNGYFTATVAETLSGDYAVRVTVGGANVWVGGVLYSGETIVDRAATTANQTTIIANQATHLAAINNVNPVAPTSVSRVSGVTIKAYLNESMDVPPITTYDFDGTGFDPSGTTCEAIIETLDGTDVEVIADGSLTKTTSTVAFTTAAATNASEQQKRWAIRVVTGKQVLAHGPYVVEQVAGSD